MLWKIFGVKRQDVHNVPPPPAPLPRRQLLQNVPTDVGFICDKFAVLTDTKQGTFSSNGMFGK